MAYINTGAEGEKLIDIIRKLGNKSYEYIECRCKWADHDGNLNDDFFGCCAYNSETETLTSLDGDLYSLEDLYVDWKESKQDDKYILTVWEKGTLG